MVNVASSRHLAEFARRVSTDDPPYVVLPGRNRPLQTASVLFTPQALHQFVGSAFDLKLECLYLRDARGGINYCLQSR